MRWEFSSRAFFCIKGTVIMDIKIQRVIHIVTQTHDPNPDSVAASRLKSMMKWYIAGMPTPILMDTMAPART